VFEVGFFELVLIFGVALIVLGPTRLPGLVSKVGRWVGKARTMARQFREQLENEVNLDELSRMTEARSKPAASTPAPPPEFQGEPVPPAPAAETAAPTDDSFSHAHAEGDAPIPYVPEAADSTPAPPETAEPVTTQPAAGSESHERQV
jgi:sec-independent protein translocase protein TatB